MSPLLQLKGDGQAANVSRGGTGLFLRVDTVPILCHSWGCFGSCTEGPTAPNPWGLRVFPPGVPAQNEGGRSVSIQRRTGHYWGNKGKHQGNKANSNTVWAGTAAGEQEAGPAPAAHSGDAAQPHTVGCWGRDRVLGLLKERD